MRRCGLFLVAFFIVSTVYAQSLGNPLLAQFRSQRFQPPQISVKSTETLHNDNGGAPPLGIQFASADVERNPSPLPAPRKLNSEVMAEAKAPAPARLQEEAKTPTPSPSTVSSSPANESIKTRRSLESDYDDSGAAASRRMIFIVMLCCALIVLCMLGVAVYKFVSDIR
jgi:hypothetical protein